MSTPITDARVTMPAISLRFLHWNIHGWSDPAGGSNADAVITVIRQHQPHVVSLVEVDETWSQPSTLDRVAAETGYTPIFVPAFEYGDRAASGGFGNAILTRLPITAVISRQLSWPDTTYDRSEPSEPRSVLLVTVTTDEGAYLQVGTTHLPRHREDSREHALNQLLNILDSTATPWVTCGDFNTPADLWVPSGLAMAPQAALTHPVGTHLGGPTEPIDYAIASPGIRLTGTALEAAGSDHLAILVEVSAPRQDS